MSIGEWVDIRKREVLQRLLVLFQEESPNHMIIQRNIGLLSVFENLHEHASSITLENVRTEEQRIRSSNSSPTSRYIGELIAISETADQLSRTSPPPPQPIGTQTRTGDRSWEGTAVGDVRVINETPDAFTYSVSLPREVIDFMQTNQPPTNILSPEMHDLLSGALRLPENVRVTLTPEQFDRLSLRTDTETETCAICQTMSDETMVETPCNHLFHVECARQHFVHYSVHCPTCRHDLRDE